MPSITNSQEKEGLIEGDTWLAFLMIIEGVLHLISSSVFCFGSCEGRESHFKRYVVGKAAILILHFWTRFWIQLVNVTVRSKHHCQMSNLTWIPLSLSWVFFHTVPRMCNFKKSLKHSVPGSVRGRPTHHSTS